MHRTKFGPYRSCSLWGKYVLVNMRDEGWKAMAPFPGEIQPCGAQLKVRAWFWCLVASLVWICRTVSEIKIFEWNNNISAKTLFYPFTGGASGWGAQPHETLLSWCIVPNLVHIGWVVCEENMFLSNVNGWMAGHWNPLFELFQRNNLKMVPTYSMVFLWKFIKWTGEKQRKGDIYTPASLYPRFNEVGGI